MEKTGQTRPIRALIFAALFSVILAGCARKAPGPEECHAFAVRWATLSAARIHRLAPGMESAPLDEDAMEQAIYSKTLECLGTPYERAFVECVLNGGTPALCRRPALEFQQD